MAPCSRVGSSRPPLSPCSREVGEGEATRQYQTRRLARQRSLGFKVRSRAKATCLSFAGSEVPVNFSQTSAQTTVSTTTEGARGQHEYKDTHLVRCCCALQTTAAGGCPGCADSRATRPGGAKPSPDSPRRLSIARMRKARPARREKRTVRPRRQSRVGPPRI